MGTTWTLSQELHEEGRIQTVQCTTQELVANKDTGPLAA